MQVSISDTLFPPTGHTTDGCEVPEVDRARVDALAASLIDVESAGDLAEMFRLLGDPTRVRILFALVAAGELCVCDIAAVVGTTETKVSQAMRLLRHAGVVRNRRDGRNIYYRLDDEHVETVLELSREHLDHRERQDTDLAKLGNGVSADGR